MIHHGAPIWVGRASGRRRCGVDGRMMSPSSAASGRSAGPSILTGLVVCGCCGHALAAVGQDYLRCARADRNGLCSNRKGIRHPVLEDLFIGSLQDNLMQPELVEEFIAAFHAEVNRNRGDAEHGRRRH
jgi:hypothetical protein